MVSPETQYREASERQRQNDRFIWQIPTIVVTVDGALLVTTFALLDLWILRELLLLISLVITVILTFDVYKNRYFYEISGDTLTEIEKIHAEKHIQRFSNPRKMEKGYWIENKGNWLQKKSAHNWLFGEW
jgi:hypothetical protein